jgi:hypothetical protein
MVFTPATPNILRLELQGKNCSQYSMIVAKGLTCRTTDSHAALEERPVAKEAEGGCISPALTGFLGHFKFLYEQTP